MSMFDIPLKKVRLKNDVECPARDSRFFLDPLDPEQEKIVADLVEKRVSKECAEHHVRTEKWKLAKLNDEKEVIPKGEEVEVIEKIVYTDGTKILWIRWKGIDARTPGNNVEPVP